MFADWIDIYTVLISIVSLTQSRTDSKESLIEDLCRSGCPEGISLVKEWPYLGLFELGRCAHTEQASMNTHMHVFAYSLTQMNTNKIEGWNLFHKPYVPSFQKDFLERVYSTFVCSSTKNYHYVPVNIIMGLLMIICVF